MKTRKTARKNTKKNPVLKKKVKSVGELINHGAMQEIPLTESFFTGSDHEPKKSKGADEEL